MKQRITGKLTMELLSDTIFGSGFSIPGGEDIAVYQDESGYPYLKGSTLKGLLRESLQNLLAWSGMDDCSGELLGESGWQGTTDGRRIQLTALVLQQLPAESQLCYGNRTFTALEAGVVAEGTLRTASCIRQGLRFVGEVTCAEQDFPLVQQAFAAIKWAGTLRNRGFGRVRMRLEATGEKGNSKVRLPACTCLHYQLHTQLPVMITDGAASGENNSETKSYIPGSAVRGMVASLLAERDPDWFREHKEALLSHKTRFRNALPVSQMGYVLPAIKGFYEDKAEEHFETVVRDGSVTPGYKRAKIGEYCSIDGQRLYFWSAGTEGSMRIQKNGSDTKLFHTRAISSGQVYDGYILLDDPSLAPQIAEVFTDTVWLGADRYAGFGKCNVTLLEAAAAPAETLACGYGETDKPDRVLYMLALSPLTMLDDYGTPCGMDLAALAKLLGVGRVEIAYCSTAMSEYDGYNRSWKCRTPAVRMYDSGSLFRLICDRAPQAQALRRLQWEGLGIRRSEGFGQVLFLRKDLYEGIREKASVRPSDDCARSQAAQIRRAKYRWIMENAPSIAACGLSRSQLGSLQAVCEKAMAMGGDTAELQLFLEKNLNDRGVEHGSKFQKIYRMVNDLLNTSLQITLGITGTEDSVTARLQLLCMLIDHSRKLEKGGTTK